jgi:hypothetical protein
MMRGGWIFFVLIALCAVSRGDTSTLVGRGVDIRDVLLPGPELHIRKSRGLADPLMVRIMATYPHGTLGFRYDFHCVPMLAGKHDLSQFLETADGVAAKGLPAIMVEATGVLPAGPPGELTDVPLAALPKAGGYERMIPYGIALWLAAGVAGVWYYRRQKSHEALAASPPPPTLAEKVKALLSRAIAEPLATGEVAELERLLLAHGREQLGLAEATDPAVWSALRENPQTASLLRSLESWLHRPTTSPPTTAELQAMLARIP